MDKGIVNIAQTIESTKAVSADKGKIVYSVVKQRILNSEEVSLDFYGLTDLTTAFLNVAIGHLYNDFSSEVLNGKLKLINTTSLDNYLIKKVIKVVKMKGKENFNEKLKEEFNDGDY